MAVNLKRKLLIGSVPTGGTYAEFKVIENKATYVMAVR